MLAPTSVAKTSPHTMMRFLDSRKRVRRVGPVIRRDDVRRCALRQGGMFPFATWRVPARVLPTCNSRSTSPSHELRRASAAPEGCVCPGSPLHLPPSGLLLRHRAAARPPPAHISTHSFVFRFMSHQVTLYDTTLRDGTQGEGVNFSSHDKLRIAHELDAFGVHYIEGGWPGSNPKDVEFFELAKKQTFKRAKIAAFGSTRRKDIKAQEDPQVLTLLAAETPVVTFYGKSWLLHVKEVLNTTADENRAMIRDTVRLCKDAGREVFYDAEHFFDGFKDEPEYALATLGAALEGGADVLVLCETNGGCLPHEIEDIVRQVQKRFPEAKIGIHTHDDGGVGVANALAAIRAGATQVQGTMNGYGERTGNCNLTTVIPNLQLKMGIP